LGKPRDALLQAANKLSEETPGNFSAMRFLKTVSGVSGLY